MISIRNASAAFAATSALWFAAGTVLAQTPDGTPPSREFACERAGLTGSLLGLCRAYWASNDCDVAKLRGNKAACQAIAANFKAQSGGLDITKIFLPQVVTTVPATGGEVSLSGYTKVTFPAGAFAGATPVTVRATQDPATAERFDEFAVMFRPANRLSYEVRVIAGAIPPISPTVRIEMVVPEALLAAMPAGHQMELFGQLLSKAEESAEIFEIIPASYDAITKTLIADVPTAYFSNNRSSGSNFEAVFTVAPTPGANRTVSSLRSPTGSTLLNAATAAATTTSQCQASSISCPVVGGCTVTSPFAPARVNPVTGVTQAHAGVDYRAPTGTSIVAAEAGTIERSYTSTTYGETIIVRHTNGGATLYAHLEQRLAQAGATVTRGQQIGVSDNTGQSTGPHLHFEYVPNGQIIQSKNRIDPDACVNTLASGSITVRDNGNIADDAFEVYLDGILIGSTAIGASNTLAINNLIPGNHTLRLVAIVAPDNVGTYEIRLSDGLTFAGSLSVVSGVISQGGSATYTIVVPQPNP